VLAEAASRRLGSGMTGRPIDRPPRRAVRRYDFYRNQIITAMDNTTDAETAIGRAIGTIAACLAALDERIKRIEENQ
jgi:hypothetical protein